MSEEPPRQQQTTLLWAVGLTAVGLIWLGQGLGFIGGSFMTDQTMWAVIGGVCVLAGVVLFVIDKRR